MAERDTSRDYYTQEDDEKIIRIMKVWAPLRRKAKREGNLHLVPIPEFVAQKVYQIAEHQSRSAKWFNAVSREDMVAHAACETLRYIHGFDPNKIGERSQKVNFFSYVTGAIKNYFGHYTESEAEQQYFKDEAYVRQYSSSLDGSEEVLDTGVSLDAVDNTDIGRDISTRASSYEQRLLEKKKRSKERREAKVPPKKETKSKMFQYFQQNKGESNES